MKPKNALVKDGFLPPGSENKRGRLSGAAIARLKELAAKGWDIDGYSVTKSITPDTAPVVTRTPVEGKTLESIPDERRSENDWQASALNRKGERVEVGMREVCHNCGSSFTYCYCPESVFRVDYDYPAVVRFAPRTTPLPNKRW